MVEEERKTRHKNQKEKCIVILPVENSVRFGRQSVGSVDDIGVYIMGDDLTKHCSCS